MSDKKAKTTTPKNKGGRPKADKKGAMVWVSAELLDAVQAYIELLKQQHNQRQAKQ